MSALHTIRWKVIQFIARRLPPCRVITHLLSEARDRKLTVRERITLRSHLLVCTWCTRFGHQIARLEEALQTAGKNPEQLIGSDSGLSEAARERIRRSLTTDN